MCINPYAWQKQKKIFSKVIKDSQLKHNGNKANHKVYTEPWYYNQKIPDSKIRLAVTLELPKKDY